MDFGISLDPSLVTQRHSLEDSSDEENVENTRDYDISKTFCISNHEYLSKGPNLIIAVGQAPSIFVKSHFKLDSLPLSRITANSAAVFRDKHFPADTHNSDCIVSEMFDISSKDSITEKFTLFIHEQQLKSQYCNVWCAKVRVCVCVCVFLPPDCYNISHTGYSTDSAKACGDPCV